MNIFNIFEKYIFLFFPLNSHFIQHICCCCFFFFSSRKSHCSLKMNLFYLQLVCFCSVLLNLKWSTLSKIKNKNGRYSINWCAWPEPDTNKKRTLNICIRMEWERKNTVEINSNNKLLDSIKSIMQLSVAKGILNFFISKIQTKIDRCS